MMRDTTRASRVQEREGGGGGGEVGGIGKWYKDHEEKRSIIYKRGTFRKRERADSERQREGGRKGRRRRRGRTRNTIEDGTENKTTRKNLT